MFCPKCGKEYIDGSRFCSSCGYNLETSSFLNSNEPSSANFQENILSIKSKEKSLVVAGLLNIALIGAGYFYVGNYVWGIILVVAAILSFIYAPEMMLALFLLATIGSIYAAHRHNKKLFHDLLKSNSNKIT